LIRRADHKARAGLKADLFQVIKTLLSEILQLNLLHNQTGVFPGVTDTAEASGFLLFRHSL
jgi:hypothetical protein